MSDEQKWQTYENIEEKKDRYWAWFKESDDKAKSLTQKVENLTTAVKALSQSL